MAESNNTPKISIGLPVFNGEKYISQTIEAILSQTFTDFELIITDNASTDCTQSICKTFAAQDERIRYIRNPENIGAAANYNKCFKLSRGQYFRWNAHDDLINDVFLEKAAAFLDSHQETDTACASISYIDKNGNKRKQSTKKTRDIKPYRASDIKTIPDMTKISAAEKYCALVDLCGFDNAIFGLIRREAVKKTSLHQKYYASDQAFVAELGMAGNFTMVPEAILYTRDHKNRSSNMQSKAIRHKWIAPDTSERFYFEHLNLLRQHLHTAWQYRHEAPLHKTLPFLMWWATRPYRLGWYGMEIIGALCPRLRDQIIHLARRNPA